jgi:CheY-like chemotaxis protein
MGNKTTFIVADCDKFSVLLLEEIIQSLILQDDDYQIVSTCYGEEVIRLCSQQKVCLILTEIKLLDMSGWELNRQIKKKHSWIPVLLQTATVTNDLHKKVKKEGFNDYITKPIDLKKMVTKINQTLEVKLFNNIG